MGFIHVDCLCASDNKLIRMYFSSTFFSDLVTNHPCGRSLLL